MIVGSILLALGLDAWWAGRQDRAFEQEALARLEVEFRENLGRVETSDRPIARLLALHEMMQALSSAVDSAAIPDSLLAGLIGSGTFDRVTPVLDGLVQSGRWELIRSSEVREAVAWWERGHAQVEEREEFAREFVETRLRPALAVRGDISPLMADYRPGRSTELTGSTVLMIDAELKALVAEKYNRDRQNLDWRRIVHGALENVLEAISLARDSRALN